MIDGVPPIDATWPPDIFVGDFTRDQEWSTVSWKCLLTNGHLTYELGNKSVHYIKLLSSEHTYPYWG